MKIVKKPIKVDGPPVGVKVVTPEGEGVIQGKRLSHTNEVLYDVYLGPGNLRIYRRHDLKRS